VQKANYYFQGHSETAYAEHKFSGGLDDNWHTKDQTDLEALVFHPCGESRNLNINTELRVNVGSSNPTKTTSFMSMDSSDGAIDTIYRFVWKTCRR
jgi:hypothetical protein